MLFRSPNATIYMFGGSVWEIVKAPSAAIGNGADFARAVLAYDPEATAADAVRLACKLDVFSGLPIHTVCL